MSIIINIIKSRLGMAILLPAGLVLLAVISFFIILFGRYQQRREIARGMSRVLSALWDGQGDCTFSAWSYRMLVNDKRWGSPRVQFVDAINNEPGHCWAAYEWHLMHGLFDNIDSED